MSKTAGASAGANDAEVRIGPASDMTEVQRAELLVEEAKTTVSRMQTKVDKAERQLKDAKAAYATAQDNAKAAARELARAKREED